MVLREEGEEGPLFVVLVHHLHDLFGRGRGKRVREGGREGERKREREIGGESGGDLGDSLICRELDVADGDVDRVTEEVFCDSLNRHWPCRTEHAHLRIGIR